MNNLIFTFLFLFFGVYFTTIGYLNLKKDRKILDFLALIDLQLIKMTRGVDAYEQRKRILLDPWTQKMFSINYLILGIGSTCLSVITLLV
jgi:hypothetical protein